MLELSGITTVYLACSVTDLRKSYNGLAAIIKLKFNLDPYSRCISHSAIADAHPLKSCNGMELVFGYS